MQTDANCLVCFKAGGNLNIFTTFNICNEKEELYVDVIKNCFNIEIALDSGLTAMCNECGIKLRRSYNFKNEIIEGIQKLLSLQVIADEAINENDKEYSQVEYLEDIPESEYNIKAVLNPETGQVSYTLDNIDEPKEINAENTYSIDLDNVAIIDKEAGESKVDKHNEIDIQTNANLEEFGNVYNLENFNENDAYLIVNKEELSEVDKFENKAKNENAELAASDKVCTLGNLNGNDAYIIINKEEISKVGKCKKYTKKAKAKVEPENMHTVNTFNGNDTYIIVNKQELGKVGKRKKNTKKANAELNKSENMCNLDKLSGNDAYVIVNKEKIGKVGKGKKNSRKAGTELNESENTDTVGKLKEKDASVTAKKETSKVNKCKRVKKKVVEIKIESDTVLKHDTNEMSCALKETNANELLEKSTETTDSFTLEDINSIIENDNKSNSNFEFKDEKNQTDAKTECGFQPTSEMSMITNEMNESGQNIYLLNIGVGIDDPLNLNIDSVESVKSEDFDINVDTDGIILNPETDIISLDKINVMEMDKIDPNSFLISNNDVAKKEDNGKEIVDKVLDTLNKSVPEKEDSSKKDEVKHEIVVKKAKRPTVNQFTLKPGQTVCDICEAKFETTKTLSTHMNVHYPEFTCPICGLEFSSKRRMAMHEKSHDEGPFKCKFCEKEFKNVNTCNTHMWRVHSKTEPFKCAVCGERFKTYLKRLRHLQTAHGQTADYTCELCNKSFAYAAYRSKHMRIMHLDSRPHKCTKCPSAFARRRELDRHLASKHDVGEKKFHCDLCQKRFYFKTELKWHSNNAHKDCFICLKCGQKFLSTLELELHIKWHQNEENVCITMDLDTSLPLEELTEDYALMDSHYLDLNEL